MSQTPQSWFFDMPLILRRWVYTCQIQSKLSQGKKTESGRAQGCRYDCERIEELVGAEMHSSDFQEIDVSCHCINWLSETLREEKRCNRWEVRGRVTMMERWRGGERRDEGQTGSEVKIGEKGKVSVKCLIKGWRLGGEGFRSKDLHRQENKWRQRWLGFNYGQRKPHVAKLS